MCNTIFKIRYARRPCSQNCGSDWPPRVRDIKCKNDEDNENGEKDGSSSCNTLTYTLPLEYNCAPHLVVRMIIPKIRRYMDAVRNFRTSVYGSKWRALHVNVRPYVYQWAYHAFFQDYIHRYYSHISNQVKNRIHMELHNNRLPRGVTMDSRGHEDMLQEYQDEICQMVDKFQDDRILRIGLDIRQQPQQARDFFKYPLTHTEDTLDQLLREIESGQLTVEHYWITHAYTLPEFSEHYS